MRGQAISTVNMRCVGVKRVMWNLSFFGLFLRFPFLGGLSITAGSPCRAFGCGSPEAEAEEEAREAMGKQRSVSDFCVRRGPRFPLAPHFDGKPILAEDLVVAQWL